MSFDSRVARLAERFLSDRSFQLIVVPALADLQFEDLAGRRRAANRVAVLRAVAGGLCDDLIRGCGSFVALMVVPAAYYIFMLVMCFDFFSIAISRDFFVVAGMILVLSFGPVMVCFWPERPASRPVD